MTHVNPDGFQGYPGTVLAQVTYELLPDNTFSGKYTAMVSKPTPINLTNHSYFNLAGHVSDKFLHRKYFCFYFNVPLLNVFVQDKGHSEIYNHEVTLNADRITITDADSIPTGDFMSVLGSNYDLRVARNLGESIAKIQNNGFDDNFCVKRGSDQTITFVAW